MAIDTKNLQKIINLCRKNGVQELEVEGIKLKLANSVPRRTTKKHSTNIKEDIAESFSDEDMLYWSSQGIN